MLCIVSLHLQYYYRFFVQCAIICNLEYLYYKQACAAIYLASIDQGIVLPLTPRPWWHVFIGPNYDQDLSIVCNSLLALNDDDCIDGYQDAMKKYVVSLVEEDENTCGNGGGSFNDPGSYIWNAID